MRRRTAALLLLGLVLTAAVAGCASVDTRDPLEPLNRQVYAFNDDVDRKILRPVAEAYQNRVPSPVRTGVSNFFSNLGDVVVFLNDLLQLKLEQGASDGLRLAVNTVFGLGGLIDVGTPIGLPKHQEDFGQTLGAWGVGQGPYLVLPFLGPSTIRDTVGWAGDWQVSPNARVDERQTRYELLGLQVVDTRAGLLQASRVFEQAALDPYAFMRDAYFQRRRSLVYDGNPPRERFEDFDDNFQLDAPGSAPPQ